MLGHNTQFGLQFQIIIGTVFFGSNGNLVHHLLATYTPENYIRFPVGKHVVEVVIVVVEPLDS